MNYQKIKSSERKNSMHFYVISERCLYSFVSSYGQTLYLSCIDVHCKCKATLEEEVLTRSNDEQHVHGDHEHVAMVEIEYERLRHTIRTDLRPLRILHQEALHQLPRAIRAMLPWRRIHRTLQRIRSSALPSINTLEEFEAQLEDDTSLFNQKYGETSVGKPFYQGAVNHQLVFANLDLIGELQPEFEMFVDATFSVLPCKAKQLLVVMVDIHGYPRPVLYAILTGMVVNLVQNMKNITF